MVLFKKEGLSKSKIVISEIFSDVYTIIDHIYIYIYIKVYDL